MCWNDPSCRLLIPALTLEFDRNKLIGVERLILETISFHLNLRTSSPYTGPTVRGSSTSNNVFGYVIKLAMANKGMTARLLANPTHCGQPPATLLPSLSTSRSMFTGPWHHCHIPRTPSPWLAFTWPPSSIRNTRIPSRQQTSNGQTIYLGWVLTGLSTTHATSSTSKV
jgi:hypothetical protein